MESEEGPDVCEDVVAKESCWLMGTGVCEVLGVAS